jgi:hypothetical protein
VTGGRRISANSTSEKNMKRGTRKGGKHEGERKKEERKIKNPS